MMKPNPKKAANSFGSYVRDVSKAVQCFGNYVRDVSKALLAKDQEMLDCANRERDKQPFEASSKMVSRRNSFYSQAKKTEVYPIYSLEVSLLQKGHGYSFLMDECALSTESYLLLTVANSIDLKSAATVLTCNGLMGTSEEIIHYIDMLRSTQPKQIIIRDETQEILYEAEIDEAFLWKLYHSKTHIVKKKGNQYVVEHV